MDDLRQIRRARTADHDTLVALWERSVRATHDFLTEADIVALRPLVREALSDEALELWVLTERTDVAIGFMGLAGHDIAALFLEPAHRGQGGGRQLVGHAQQLCDGDLTVDVNEQNPAARGFYEALGFVVVGRSPLDEGGRPFPVLHMRRPTTSDSSGAPSHSSHSATSGALASVDAADPADFHLRIAAMEDLPALRDVFRRSSLSNEGDRQSLLSHPDALEFSDRAVADGRVRVAVVADRLVGFATVLGTGQIGELEDLFVDPDWMRRGIATELVLDALANAREQGVARIEVTANEHALAFYESVGFISDGISETRFGRGHRMHVDVPPSPGAALPSKPSRKD